MAEDNQLEGTVAHGWKSRCGCSARYGTSPILPKPARHEYIDYRRTWAVAWDPISEIEPWHRKHICALHQSIPDNSCYHSLCTSLLENDQGAINYTGGFGRFVWCSSQPICSYARLSMEAFPTSLTRCWGLVCSIGSTSATVPLAVGDEC